MPEHSSPDRRHGCTIELVEERLHHRDRPPRAPVHGRPPSSGGGPRPAASIVLQLQRSAGNAATTAVLQRAPAAPARAPAEAGPAGAPPPAARGPDFSALADQVETSIAELRSADADVQRLKKDRTATKAQRRAAARGHRLAVRRYQAATLRLASWVRERLPRKDLIDGYLERTDVPSAQKVATLGKLSAATARMEFLLGTMYHQGVRARWEKGNVGAFPDTYHEAVGGGGTQPWCTKFAGYAYARLGFRSAKDERSMFLSGYRLRHWSRTGKSVDNKRVLTPADRTVAAEGSSGTLLDSGEWKKLTAALKKARTPEARAAATSAFFATRTAPQPGDTLVKSRGEGAGSNAFSAKAQSHTMLVDRFDPSAWTVSTVEGNAGDRVGARVIDLTDPVKVSQIVFLTRLGTEHFGDPDTDRSAPPPGGPFGWLGTLVHRAVYSETVLLAEPEAVIARLVSISAAQDWIKSSDAAASVHTWITGSAAAGPAGAVKEN